MTLLVRVRSPTPTDRLGNEVVGYADAVAVPGCLWAPGRPADIGSERPDGVAVSATAHFPQGWSGSLRGALVSLDGKEWLRVVGDPVAYPTGAVRGPWGTYVLLSRGDG